MRKEDSFALEVLEKLKSHKDWGGLHWEIRLCVEKALRAYAMGNYVHAKRLMRRVRKKWTLEAEWGILAIIDRELASFVGG